MLKNFPLCAIIGKIVHGGGDVADNKGKCFVIMPISDPDGYEEGHFESVYRDIFVPAIEDAGYEPHRVDEDVSTGVIQAKILEQLINAPMAICDLSTRNPNVLFELGIRQAYDKPVVLVQEKGTDRIFDINEISYINYEPSLVYRSVVDVQKKITSAITETAKNPKYNSLITALKISAAEPPKNDLNSQEFNEIMLGSIVNKLDNMASEIRSMRAGQKSESPQFRPLPVFEQSEAALARREYSKKLSHINSIRKEILHFEQMIERGEVPEKELRRINRMIEADKRTLCELTKDINES